MKKLRRTCSFGARAHLHPCMLHAHHPAGMPRSRVGRSGLKLKRRRKRRQSQDDNPTAHSPHSLPQTAWYCSDCDVHQPVPLRAAH